MRTLAGVIALPRTTIGFTVPLVIALLHTMPVRAVITSFAITNQETVAQFDPEIGVLTDVLVYPPERINRLLWITNVGVANANISADLFAGCSVVAPGAGATVSPGHTSSDSIGPLSPGTASDQLFWTYRYDVPTALAGVPLPSSDWPIYVGNGTVTVTTVATGYVATASDQPIVTGADVEWRLTEPCESVKVIYYGIPYPRIESIAVSADTVTLSITNLSNGLRTTNIVERAHNPSGDDWQLVGVLDNQIYHATTWTTYLTNSPARAFYRIRAINSGTNGWIACAPAVNPSNP